jgi:dsDNA-specific endonuclease/ATPase MutS2
MDNLMPYMPGDEARLEGELDRLERMCRVSLSHRQEWEGLAAVFHAMKDVSATIERSSHETLSVVELYEVKALLLQMEESRAIIAGMGDGWPSNLTPAAADGLLDLLDPEGSRLPAFYIYDQFSEKLANLRKEKKDKELALRREQKKLAEEAEARLGIKLSPKFDASVPRSETEKLAAAESSPLLQVGGEDFSSVTFQLRLGAEGRRLTAEADTIGALVEDEELAVRKRLSKEVAKYAPLLLKNCRVIGDADFVMAKTDHAIRHDCVKPGVVRIHTLRLEDGRYLPLERLLREKGQDYSPVSIFLDEGVSCITGANMGGKTISMKLAGLVALMAQHGFFVPCKSAFVGLSSSAHILIGDSQDMQKGLSSFGSEMEGLGEILSKSGEKALIFIDEIAGSTNPAEGRALTKALIGYLSKRPYITLMTTHFERVAEGAGVVNLRVHGLSSADFDRLSAELRNAGINDRIEIITRFMDYRLERVNGGAEIPKDALRIAEILGIKREIIDGAREILEAQAQ